MQLMTTSHRATSLNNSKTTHESIIDKVNQSTEYYNKKNKIIQNTHSYRYIKVL